MELHLVLVKILLTILLIGFINLIKRLFDALILKPRRLRSRLQKQGIEGPPSSLLLGNLQDIKKIRFKWSKSLEEGNQEITHNCSSLVFPSFDKWREQYGSTFMFSMGNTQILHLSSPELLKEISISTSFALGRPSTNQIAVEPLLGQGIVAANGALWAQQRKILAPEFYMERVKGFVKLMVESSITIVNSWNSKIDSEGGVADIKIDDYLRSLSGDVISKACFGSNYSKGEDIFLKIRALIDYVPARVLYLSIPGTRYLPIKINTESRRLEKEIRALILKVVKEREEGSSEMDLLQIILEGAKSSNSGQDETNRFIVDNCKNMYLAGYETSAVTAAWTLMLLALYPEWQEKVRAEILDICSGELPNADMLLKMKTATMVINEVLRLYPPVSFLTREALEDIKLGDINVPKGVNLWIMVVTLHTDPSIWGPDADKFNPERFANGVTGACKFPHVYMPFGTGSHTCLGQYFAMAELKVLFSLLLSNFSFSLSPRYKHSPAMNLIMEPQYGVDLLVRKL
ncbi:cytochrome P450 714C2-like [Durio zibethinus]|uniref:Cytochrome P450 714C2-like n=1 Tax=Durio zibethinus TaxID=66656 RepID=A0A6P6AIB9_DURZI|nr:cytochrome P450 714C2-like [Durio zibethinus]